MPVLDRIGDNPQAFVREVTDRPAGPFEIGNQLRQTLWDKMAQYRVDGLAPLLGPGPAQFLKQVDTGGHVEHDLVALTPIGRDLQDRWAAKTAMGKEHGLREFGLAAGDHRIERDA